MMRCFYKTALLFLSASLVSCTALAQENIVSRENPFPKNEKVSISVLCGLKITNVSIINGEKGSAKVADATQEGFSATKDSIAKVNSTINRSRAVYLSNPYCEGKNSVSFLVSGSYFDTKMGEEDDFTLRMSLDFGAI